MRKLIVYLTFCLVLLVIGYHVRALVDRDIKSHQKRYTIRVCNGSPQLWYEAKIQIDSFEIISSKCAFVYADGNFLKINAEMITISKN
ncbi:MAG: hypothetical protein WCK18_20410 [Prolixibacteraceae bacterium]